MYIEFLESIIYDANPYLNQDDLKILFKISKDYQFRTYYLFHKNLNEIVGMAICHNLPYWVAKKLIDNDELYTDVVKYDGTHFINCLHLIEGQEYVNFHIEKINKLLDES